MGMSAISVSPASRSPSTPSRSSSGPRSNCQRPGTQAVRGESGLLGACFQSRRTVIARRSSSLLGRPSGGFSEFIGARQVSWLAAYRRRRLPGLDQVQCERSVGTPLTVAGGDHGLAQRPTGFPLPSGKQSSADRDAVFEEVPASRGVAQTGGAAGACVAPSNPKPAPDARGRLRLDDMADSTPNIASKRESPQTWMEPIASARAVKMVAVGPIAAPSLGPARASTSIRTPARSSSGRRARSNYAQNRKPGRSLRASFPTRCWPSSHRSPSLRRRQDRAARHRRRRRRPQRPREARRRPTRGPLAKRMALRLELQRSGRMRSADGRTNRTGGRPRSPNLGAQRPHRPREP